MNRKKADVPKTKRSYNRKKVTGTSSIPLIPDPESLKSNGDPLAAGYALSIPLLQDHEVLLKIHPEGNMLKIVVQPL